MSFNENQIAKLEKSGYRFVGKHGHAAVKLATGLVKVLLIKESVIRKNSMESNHIDVFRCLLQFQIANRNVNFVGGI